MIYTRQDMNEEINEVRKQVIVFLAITFAITYIANFAMLLAFGPISQSTSAESAGHWQMALSLQMLFPAFSAIICLAIFKYRTLTNAVKVFFGYFVLFLIMTAVCLFYNPNLMTIPANIMSPVPTYISMYGILVLVMGFLGLILIFVLNINRKWREQLKPFKLSLGSRGYYYAIIPAAFIIFLTVSFSLNAIFGLGLPSAYVNPLLFFLVLISGLINGILISLLYFFGEEYGWRVYLQDRMSFLFGRIKGVILIGVIWGLWHAPIIAMGYNYPGYPVLGVIVMTLFTVVTGIIFSYAVFKTGSVWIAALLHLVLNTVAPSAIVYLSNPSSSILSFGIGIYGIVFMAVFAILLFISKEWRKQQE